MEDIIEPVQQGLALEALGPHLEQEAQVRLTLIWVDAMFCNNLIVCCKKSPKRESLNFGISFGTGDDFIEETNI